MIDVLESIVEIITGIQDFDGRVYRKWPQKKATVPSCLISRISASPLSTDADGQEMAVRFVYSVDVNASTPDQADELAGKVIDALAEYNFHRQGDTDFYDDAMRSYRRILTFMGTVDLRGNTFTD